MGGRRKYLSVYWQKHFNLFDFARQTHGCRPNELSDENSVRSLVAVIVYAYETAYVPRLLNEIVTFPCKVEWLIHIWQMLRRFSVKSDIVKWTETSLKKKRS